MAKARKKAKQMEKIIKGAYDEWEKLNKSDNDFKVSKHFNSAFSQYLKSKDSDEVIIEFIKLYNSCENLKIAVNYFIYTIKVNSWIFFKKKWEKKYPTFF